MFLQNFIKWNEGNECPDDYLLWAAYGGLSLVIGRRVYWNYGGQFFVLPNLFCLLVGPSGDRKTFARDKIVDMMYEAIPETIISTECETHQGIIKFMDSPVQERTYIDENGVQQSFHPYGLFAPELMDYMALNPIGMVNFLTNIFDRYKEYRYRLRGGDQVMHRPYFVMCSCTTDDWLTKQINADTFSQGYGRRTILVTTAGFEKMKTYYTPEHEAAKQWCIKWLQQLQTVVGPMTAEPEADKFFWDWYLTEKPSDDKFVKAWQSSKNINLLKLAMLSSLSERTDRVITLNHMQMSLELLNGVQKQLFRITDKIGRSELLEPIHAVLEYLRMNKSCVLEKELFRRMTKHFKNTMELHQTLAHMRQSEQIYRFPVKEGDVEKIYICLPDFVKKPPQ